MRFAASLNIDTQDRQDKQDEKLLHRKLTHSLIGCACEVIQELESGFWGIAVQEKVMVELKGVNALVPEHPDQTINK